MGQPVRKKIIEQHPEIAEKPFYTLLIDGTNLLRICFADNKVNNKGEHIGGIVQFFVQIRKMLAKKQYDYIYVFFDDEDSGILRFNIYNGYKANRDKKYAEHAFLSEYGKAYEAKLKEWRDKHAGKKKYVGNDDTKAYIEKYKQGKVSKETLISRFGEKQGKEMAREAEKEILDTNFKRERDFILKCCNELYIRWIFNDVTEGDDLISYYVQHKKPEERIVIMSTDEDLTQLISDTVCVYNKKIDKYLSKENYQRLRGFPVENVVIKKIMCGDTSDNIKNIAGLSEDGLFNLIPEMRERPVTVEEIKLRAQSLIDERIGEKKKPLKVHENIVNGVCNGEYDGDFYDINRKLVDLSQPLLSEEGEDEIRSMMYESQDPEGRSFENLYKYMVEDNIDDFKDDKHFATFFEPFKDLVNKEIFRYKKANR